MAITLVSLNERVPTITAEDDEQIAKVVIFLKDVLDRVPERCALTTLCSLIAMVMADYPDPVGEWDWLKSSLDKGMANLALLRKPAGGSA